MKEIKGNKIDININFPGVYKELLTRGKYRYKLISGGRGSGKSMAFGLTSLILAATEKDLKILCARDVQNSIKQSVKSMLETLIDEHGLRRFFRSAEYGIRCILSGSEFFFLGLQNIDNLRSMSKIDIMWIEEAASITDEKWKIIIPTIRKKGSEIWASWNPETEYDAIFEQFCRQFYKDGAIPFRRTIKTAGDVYYRHTTYEDNKYFPDVLERERERCLKEFPQDYDWIWGGRPFSKDGYKYFISGDIVKASQDNYRDWIEVLDFPKVLGIDPKREGYDDFVIVLRQGKKASELKVIKQPVDTMTGVGYIIEAINEHNPEAIFIDSGKGEGIIDKLRELNYANIIEVKFGSKATKENRYRNKRAEMYGAVKDWLTDGGNIPDGIDWYRDVSETQYAVDENNRVALERKDKVVERIGRSPGLMDALALTFAYPVSANEINNIFQKQKTYFAKGVDYDPLASLTERLNRV